MNPKVSVIIPYYKKIKYFKKTLISVLKQTYKNFEVIIIYDDKDKKDLLLIKKIIKNKKNIKLIINNKNYGVGISRNIGIKKAQGKYISFLDADDKWVKTKLSYQIKFMQKNKLRFTHTSYNIINENDYLIGFIKAKKKITYKELLKSCDIGLSTVILEKKIINNLNFNNFKTKEDYSLWLNLLKKNIKIIGINKKLTYWRTTPNSLSSSIFQKLMDGFKVYYKEQKFNFLSSCYHLVILTLYASIKKTNVFLNRINSNQN